MQKSDAKMKQNETKLMPGRQIVSENNSYKESREKLEYFEQSNTPGFEFSTEKDRMMYLHIKSENKSLQSTLKPKFRI